jgi:hypothetical protein
MADNRYKQVQAFNAPTAYDQQMVEARRRRRMAEALAQQAYTPQDVGVAPIPAAAPLVQGLQAFLSARAARKADEAEEMAKGAQTAEARDFLRALTEPGKKMTVGEAAVQDITQMGTPEVVDGRIEYRKTAMPAPTPEMIPQAGPQVRLGRKPEDDMVYAPTRTGVETDPQRLAALLATPEMKAEFSPEQKRALALEGMLTSRNPLVQQIGQMQYGAMQPKQPEIGAVDPADFTPESLAEYQRTGDFGVLQLREQPAKAPTTVGGMMWDAAQGKFVDIPGYESQQGRIAAAKRPDVVVRDTTPKGPSESALWRAEDKLRGDFEQITAPFRAQLAETQKITDIFKNYGNDPKAIAAIPQQSLVILLNKFLDPTSVVREGEFNRVVEAQGLEARARNYIARIMEGKPLDVSAINQIADLAKLYERAADAKIRQYAGEYATVAETRGLDVGSIITNPNYRPRKKIADEDVEVQ